MIDSANYQNASPLEISKPLFKTLASTGHVVAKFLLARKILLQRAAKSGQFDELKPWLTGLNSANVPLIEKGGTFVSAFQFGESGLTFEQFVVDQATAQLAIDLWKQVEPSATDVSTPLDVSATANATIWPALLRLRFLREFWEQELRRNHFELLVSLVPDAWVLDPAPLPPGAVIPRLELANWDGLEAKENRYLLGEATATAGTFEPYTKAALDYALKKFPNPVSVLQEKSAAEDGMFILAIHCQTGSKTELIGGIAMKREEKDVFTIAKVIAH